MRIGHPTDHVPKARPHASNLIELLCTRAQLQETNSKAYTFLKNGETEVDSLTYQELDQRARAIAVQLRRLVPPGSRALLIYPPGLDFVAGFYGCLYAEVIAVPTYPPRPNQPLAYLQSIATDAQVTIALTTTSQLAKLEIKFDQNPELSSLSWLATDTLPSQLAHDWQLPAINGDTIAVLQYTSGSTGAPKGVMVSHRNLMSNSALISQCFEFTPECRGGLWLPPYHDMGLIGGWSNRYMTGSQFS